MTSEIKEARSDLGPPSALEGPDMPDFAIVDVETTGLYARSSDRIIEIAILRLGRDGQEISRYSTLINPKRDLGSTWYHGIQTRDVLDAPTFADVAGDVLEHLRGSILVGHYVRSDTRFLTKEFKRLGVTFPNPPTLDTFQLAQMADHLLPGRRLEAICKRWEIPLETPHHAEADARATADFLIACADRMGWTLADLIPMAEEGDPQPWPDLPASGRSYPRALAKARPREATYLSKIVDRLPARSVEGPDLDSYLCTLDEVLEDRRVFEEEAEGLAELAQELGLSAELIERAHREYVLNLLIIAFEDLHISAIEEEDLLEVCQLLGVTDQEYRELREKVKNDEARDLEREWLGYGPEVLEGKTVCFTGELRGKIDGQWRIERPLAISEAENQGMIIQGRMNKDLDFLVVADPYSMSSKLRRAREYGVRIIAEPVFWRMIGLVDVR